MISLKWLLWVTLADPGCKNRRIENPRVGGSIPPLATIQIRSIPVTSVTFYTGDMGDTLAVKGFGAHSTRLH
jgi:hypothetical protein